MKYMRKTPVEAIQGRGTTRKKSLILSVLLPSPIVLRWTTVTATLIYPTQTLRGVILMLSFLSSDGL